MITGGRDENSQLVYVGSTRDTSEYRIYDYDGSAAPFITIERWNEYEQTSHELRYERQTERSTLVAGYYFWNSEFTQDWVTGGEFWRTLFGAVAQTPARRQGYASRQSNPSSQICRCRACCRRT